MKTLLLGLAILGSISSVASVGKCDVYVENSPWGGNFEHQDIKDEVRDLLVDELHAKGFNVVNTKQVASVIFDAPVSGCAQGIGWNSSPCVRSYAMIDYEFTKDNSDLNTKGLKGSAYWTSKIDGVKAVARRAFTGSDSSLFGNVSQRDAVLDAIKKIKVCK